MVLKLITEATSTESIINEYDLTKKLEGFAPAVYAVEAVEVSGKPMGVILMEAFDGDLRNLIGSAPEEALDEIERQIPALLDGIERQGLACTDLKPENVLYKRGSDGGIVLRLTDFDGSYCYAGGSPALRKLVMATLMSISIQAKYDRMFVKRGIDLRKSHCSYPGCVFRDYIVEQLMELRRAGFSTARDIFMAMSNTSRIDEEASELVTLYPYIADFYSLKFMSDGQERLFRSWRDEAGRNPAMQLIEAFMRMVPEEESGSEPEASPPRRSRLLEGRSPDLPRRRLTPTRF